MKRICWLWIFALILWTQMAQGASDYYAVLGVEPSAEKDEIRRAYRKLVKTYHPDLNPGNQKAAERKMKEINEAWDVLENDSKRADYDRSRPARTVRPSNREALRNQVTFSESDAPTQQPLEPDSRAGRPVDSRYRTYQSCRNVLGHIIDILQ